MICDCVAGDPACADPLYQNCFCVYCGHRPICHETRQAWRRSAPICEIVEDVRDLFVSMQRRWRISA